jgi:hypothetical protein
MADILRATKTVPGFHAAAQVVLVEASPRLREVQARTLSGYTPAWHDRLEDLPQNPAVPDRQRIPGCPADPAVPARLRMAGRSG